MVGYNRVFTINTSNFIYYFLANYILKVYYIIALLSKILKIYFHAILQKSCISH